MGISVEMGFVFTKNSNQTTATDIWESNQITKLCDETQKKKQNRFLVKLFRVHKHSSILLLPFAPAAK